MIIEIRQLCNGPRNILHNTYLIKKTECGKVKFYPEVEEVKKRKKLNDYARESIWETEEVKISIYFRGRRRDEILTHKRKREKV